MAVMALAGASATGKRTAPVPPVRRSHLAYALLCVGALLFLAFASRVIVAPFGDSHDGRNGGVWGGRQPEPVG